jgi:hypothetical protein
MNWHYIAVLVVTGRRPLPAVRDFTRDGRWRTYDVSVVRIKSARDDAKSVGNVGFWLCMCDAELMLL